MDLKPGRELDALVAEKVMGYTRRIVPKHSLPNTDIPGATFPREDGWLFTNSGGFDDYFMGHVNDMFVSQSRGFPETLGFVPPYSTDIAAAWGVVEKVGMGEIHEVLVGKSSTDVTDDYYCVIQFADRTVEVRAASAPHALCLAALKAVGGDQ